MIKPWIFEFTQAPGRTGEEVAPHIASAVFNDGNDAIRKTLDDSTASEAAALSVGTMVGTGVTIGARA